MMKIFLVFAFTGFACVFFCRAQQLKNFTSDAAKFPQEIKSYLEEANKSQSDDVLDPFMKAWKEGKFSSDQQEHIYNTANAMLKKRMRPFPDFSNYITTLTSFANSNQKPVSFVAWQISVDKLLKLPAKNFSAYISVCSSLFASNTLYESASTRWYSDNGDYEFDFDTLPRIVFPSLNLKCSSKGDSSVIFNTKGIY